MMKLKTHKMMMMVLASLMISSCDKVIDENYTIVTSDEMAQMIGDTLVSIDESGGRADGSIAQFNPSGYEKAFARLSRNEALASKIANQDISNLFISKSYAASCSATPFTCNTATGVATRTFADCTVAGSGKASGSVNLTFTGSGASTCTLPATNDRVVRAPNYEITGLRGAKFKTSTVSTGQSLTRVSPSAFNFLSTGIRRTFTSSDDKVVLDMTALVVTNPISVIGAYRGAPRTLSNGQLIIMNNLTSVSCTMSHTNITWAAGCNCPIDGSFAGYCTDGTTLQVVYTTNCGETKVTTGSEVRPVTMDRCQP